MTFPTPAIPSPSPYPPVTSLGAGTCASIGLTAAQCVVTGGNTITFTNTTLTPLSLPSFNLSGHEHIILTAPPVMGGAISNTYNINSVSLSGGSSIGVSTTSPNSTVTVSLAGKNPDGSEIPQVLDFAGGTYTNVTGCATCSNFDAALMQFAYGGTGELRMVGNSQACGDVLRAQCPGHLFRHG